MNQRTQNIISAIVTLMAVVAIYGVSALVNNRLNDRRTYTVKVLFDDVQGLIINNDVRLAGVKIGKVGKVEVSKPDFRRAIATLDIDNQYKIPKNSHFGVRGAIIGNTTFVVITPPIGIADPPVTEGDTLQGDKGSGVDALLADATSVIPPVRETAQGVSRIVNDKQNQENIRVTLAQLKATTAQLPAITANLKVITSQLKTTLPTVQKEVVGVAQSANSTLSDVKVAANNIARASKDADKISRNLTKASEGANGLVDDVRTIAKENGAELKEVLSQTRESIAGLQGFLAQISQTIADPKVKQNLIETTNSLAVASKKIELLTTDAQKLTSGLTSDDQVVTNLKASVANIKTTTDSVREAAASAQKVAARVEGLRLPWERRSGDKTGPNGTNGTNNNNSDAKSSLLPQFVESGLTIDTMYDTKIGRILQSSNKLSGTGRLRLDSDYVVGAKNSNNRGEYFRIGITDATEGNRLNLQRGSQKGDMAYRYGIFEGKIGVGVDYHIKSVDLRVDGFDPNNFTVNARLKRLINPSTSLTLGINSIGSSNRPVIGLQIH